MARSEDLCYLALDYSTLSDIISIMEKFLRKITFKNLLLFSLALIILFLGATIIWASSLKVPDFNSFKDRKVVNSTKIYDRNGILLYDIHQNIKRTDITWSEMSVNIKNATVAIEDSEFYNHQGIKLTSIMRAVLANIINTDGKTQGGSTITQQLVKNTLLTQSKTITRKIKEWVLALKIDASMPKEKILEFYLNENPYGGNIYGIEEASKTYFNKNARDLGLAESAYLAAIPQSPTLLSPYGRNRDKLEARKNLVLLRMLDLGFISKNEHDSARNEIVNFIPQATLGIKAPHFVFFVKSYLEEKYGRDLVEQGGLKVTTTLDYNLQAKAEEIVKEGALKNDTEWNGKNAGLVAVDPRTGQIITMVGSRDYFDKSIDSNFNIATALRQPGSSFKPFIYATAFNKGFTPNTVLFDLPTEFQLTCNAYGVAPPGYDQKKCYMPDNYDGKHRGPISLKNALAQSINIPAVKLFYLSGLSDSLKTAEDMGISTLTDPSRYGLTLVIGGGEVTLLDITSAYGVFANNGIRNPYTGILKIEDISGRIIEEYRPDPKDTLPKNTALIISDILSDNLARTPTFGANSPLYIPGKDVAVKTGTTNSNKDAWTIGYTPSIVVGVWAGNNDNKPMKKGGSAVAGPIWNKFMNEALKNLPVEKFEKPDLEAMAEAKPILRGFWQGNESFLIDKISGKLATEFTPKETIEEKIITNVHNILYWVDRKDITGPAPENPANDPQFSHWEIPVQNWWAQNSFRYPKVSYADKPVEKDNIHGPYLSSVSIVEPNTGMFYGQNERIGLKIINYGSLPLQKIDVFINEGFIGTIRSPFEFSFIPDELDNLREENEIKIISYDTAYNRSESTSIFKIMR